MLKEHPVYTGPQVLESFQHRICLIEFLEHNIIYVRIEDNAETTLEDCEAQYRLYESKYDGKNKFRILVEPGENTTLTKEAREYATVPSRNGMTAGTAVIVKSLAHRLIMNFIVKIVLQQNLKMKLFENREQAIKWLLTL